MVRSIGIIHGDGFIPVRSFFKLGEYPKGFPEETKVELNLYWHWSVKLKNLVSIGDYIRWGASQFEKNQLFYGHGTDNALDEAAFLVAHSLNLGPLIPSAYLHSRLTGAEQKALIEIIEARIESRKPAAYLTGASWFAGYRFQVNEQVLVPRSPIAELIQGQFSPWLDSNPVKRILDLCTGSACIAIACALYNEHATVLASDIDSGALSIARINVDNYELADRVELLESDLFDSIPAQRFDLIVCNPPYVSEQEWLLLPEEYKKEPKSGLCAPDQGLALVKRILNQAADYLSDSGCLIVEVGFSEDALLAACPELPLTWIEFEHGGQGVFLISRDELVT